MEDTNRYTFKYTFRLESGQEFVFDISITKEHIELEFPKRDSYPTWTELDTSKCPNCPLDSKTTPYCPMAVSIIDVVEAFKDIYSYEEIYTVVECPERTYVNTIPIQEGLSSLMGLYMATSGCPNLRKLKPMAANHLPFATLDETIYRVLSMYGLAQLFRNRETRLFDTEFKELKELYENIAIVNTQFCSRLRHLKQKDANVNAVVILNNFAEYIPFSVKENMLDKLSSMFEDYF